MNSAFRNWSDIRIFLAVIRHGSTLAAARGLGIAQPTVARRIDALEGALGLTLFERDTRGFAPTDAARSLLPLAEEIEQVMTAFADQAAALTEARPIRITAYSGNFSPRINEIFSAFSAKHPEVAFEFLPSVKVLDLAAGDADIALRITRNEPDQRLIRRKISVAQWALYAAPSYAETYGLPSGPDQLDGHRFVTFQRDDVPSDLHDWLSAQVAPDQIVMSFSEIDLMHAAIRAGHGLGLVNLRLAESENTLIRCFDPIEALNRDHLLLISPQAYRRAEVKAFTSFFAPRYAALFK